MTNILTNSAALKSLYYLQKNDGAATEATERLASGKRINKAGDDAALVHLDGHIALMNVDGHERARYLPVL